MSVSVSDHCSCMATRHKYNTSCKKCGWIACEEYNSSKCYKCQELLFPPISATEAREEGFDNDTIKAYEMLDKLLQFDKENAQRTHVHDSQADYYESGTWLTEEEKEDIDRREKLRQDAKNRRAHRKVNINFDIAGRRVVDFVKEEEEDGGGETGSSGEVARVGNLAICSPFADNDGSRPSWMYEDDRPYEGTGSGYATAAARAMADKDSEDGHDLPNSMTSGHMQATAGALEETLELPVYDNRELERNRGRAAEVYRSMKKRWESEISKDDKK